MWQAHKPSQVFQRLLDLSLNNLAKGFYDMVNLCDCILECLLEMVLAYGKDLILSALVVRHLVRLLLIDRTHGIGVLD